MAEWEHVGAVEHFETFDGARLAFRRWGARGAAVPVVLHHGFAVDGPLNWEAPGVIARLVAEGHEVVAVDALGHGASDKPHDPDRYGEDRTARDLSVLLDHLGVDRADVVGYSMGAVVAVVAATQEPRIRRLAVGGVGAGLVELGGPDQRHVSSEAIVAALEADDAADITDPGAAGFRALADATGADRLALAAQARRIRTGPIAFGDITAEALVVAGVDDPFATRPEVLADALGATLVLVPGDHLMAVVDPAFADALTSFLAK